MTTKRKEVFMIVERLMGQPIQKVAEICQPHIELIDLSAKLGVPQQYAPEYVRSLLIALGPENQPERAIGFLQFKLEGSIGTNSINGK